MTDDLAHAYSFYCVRLIELKRPNGGERALAQEQVGKQISAVDILLAIRERNRRMTLKECMQKAGLGKKFQDFSRKKNSKSS